MARRIIWSPEALSDLVAIASYIERDSEAYAKAVVRRIVERTRHLARFPNAGRRVPELASDRIREIFVYSYRVIYSISEEQVTIAAVIHGHRQIVP